MAMRSFVGVAFAGVCAFGCASAAPAIPDAELDRLGEPTLAIVDRARGSLTSAEEQRARAVRRRDEARRQLLVAEPAVEPADAHLVGARAGLDAAKASGDPGRIDLAERQLERARLFGEEELSKRDYLRRELRLREGEVSLAKRRVELARAQLEEAKLMTLRQAHDPAADRYDLGRFQASVRDRWNAFVAERERLHGEEGPTRTAFERWLALRRDLVARQGLVPARGGDGAPTQPAAPGALP